MITSIPKGPYQRLSKRELEGLHSVAAGASSPEIAKRLSPSKKTVDTYRARLMAKLGVRNRCELTRFVIEAQPTST
jgi:two-component system response regulator NreC